MREQYTWVVERKWNTAPLGHEDERGWIPWFNEFGLLGGSSREHARENLRRAYEWAEEYEYDCELRIRRYVRYPTRGE